jgi:transcriptional regulator with XRE-family HTH domain
MCHVTATIDGRAPFGQAKLPKWQYFVMDKAIDEVLTSVAPRLRALRQQREWTLATLATHTRISVSTLSRLESGRRRPNLELLLPIARAYGVPLDDLLGSLHTDDPRVQALPFTRHGMLFQPLTRRPGGLQAYRLSIPSGSDRPEPVLQTHDGYEWLYVLSGRLRLVLGEHDLILRASEAAEFDTRVPHWFHRAGTQAVELISLFGAQGERIHVRARVPGTRAL